MITLDSPVTTVLGDKATKRKRMAEGLGIETVGDLLRHFPRRYVKTGELTQVADLREGEMLTVVGEIVRSELKTYQDRRTRRPAYRLETVLQTDGPAAEDDVLRQEPGHRRVARPAPRRRPPWRLRRAGQHLPRRVAADQPEDGAVRRQRRRGGRGRAASVDNFGDLYPIYPQTKGVESWDIQRAVNFARSVIDEVPELIPDDIRDEYDVVDARRAVDLIHAPDTFAQVELGRRRYRFEEALVTQVVLGRRRAFLRTLGAQARTGGGGPAGGVRRAAAVRADRRAARDRRGRSRPTSPSRTR